MTKPRSDRTELIPILAANMELNTTRSLGVIVLLLSSSSIVRLEGMNHKLQCINDYVSILNCSLETSLPSDFSTAWLQVTNSLFKEDTYQCLLSRLNEHHHCSAKVNGFVDVDVFGISLCRKQSVSEGCELLENNYKPVKTIKPNAPCCLTLNQSSSRHHFSWESTYDPDTLFVENLKYQLRIHKRGRRRNGTAHDINTDHTTFTLEDDKFIPDSEYAAKVRSSPNQALYMGQWSAWSSAVHWRTDSAVDGRLTETTAPVFKPLKVLIPLCVLVPFILFLCFVPIKKWKQSVFIPTPEAYFQTLYSDCHGDFKSWVIIKENTMNVPKTENTSQIDKLTKCADVHEVDSCVIENSGYSNVKSGFNVDSSSEPIDSVVQLGIPFTVSPSVLPLSAGSCMSTDLYLQSGSPSEGDSGCWLSSDLSLEKGHPWYCNDYCTLSTFQQSAYSTSWEQGTHIDKVIEEACVHG